MDSLLKQLRDCHKWARIHNQPTADALDRAKRMLIQLDKAASLSERFREERNRARDERNRARDDCRRLEADCRRLQEAYRRLLSIAEEPE
jgi:hypothetical protein